MEAACQVKGATKLCIKNSIKYFVAFYLREKRVSFHLNCFDAAYAKFYPEKDKRSLLVMQNLKMMGYAEARDKKKGLGDQYLRLALEEMARFHALGRTHLKSHSGGEEAFAQRWDPVATDYMYVNKTAHYQSLEPAMAEGFLQIVAAVQDKGEEDLLERFYRFHQEKGFFTERDKLYAPCKDGFNVICHGDAWFNNVLFKYVS